MSYSFNNAIDDNPYARVYKKNRQYSGSNPIVQEEKNAYDVQMRYSSQRPNPGISSASAYDIQMLADPFENHYTSEAYCYANYYKQPTTVPTQPGKSMETVNKRLMTVESCTDLAAVPNPFAHYYDGEGSYYEAPRTSDSAYSIRGTKLSGSQPGTNSMGTRAPSGQNQNYSRESDFSAPVPSSMRFVVPADAVPNGYKTNAATSLQTINKRAVSAESAFDLNNLPIMFQDRGATDSRSSAEIILRDYCTQSLEDIHNLPSISSISLYNHPSNNVNTAIEIESNQGMQYLPDVYTAQSPFVPSVCPCSKAH